MIKRCLFVLLSVLFLTSGLYAQGAKSPLVITKGGTWSGYSFFTYDSQPAVIVETNEAVTFEECTFQSVSNAPYAVVLQTYAADVAFLECSMFGNGKGFINAVTPPQDVLFIDGNAFAGWSSILYQTPQ